MALRYKISLPAAGASDVSQRKIALTLGENLPVEHTLDGTATEFTFDVERDIAVSMTLTDVDGSGNPSLPSAPLAFTSTDTVPPPQPGPLTVLSVEQTD